VASRERKRAERRKRKARGAARETEGRKTPEGSGIATSAAAAGVEPEVKSPIERGYAKAEQRNREAREQLHPLYEGERPLVVTIGAAFSALIAVIFWVSTGIALFSDATVRGNEPHPLQLALIAVVLTLMAWGMWKARYWAVLGFQMLLVLFLLAAVAGLVAATTVLQAIGTLVLVAVCLTFFIFMVKAMARIQMPDRIPRN
jgi:amino acid transporter